MAWYSKLTTIDNRILYLLVALVIALPLVFPLNLKTFYTQPVTQVYEYLENVKDNGVIMVGLNYDAAVRPEVEPMLRSVLRHAFMRDIKVLAYGWNPEGPYLAQRLFEELGPEYGKESGVDYVNLGYKFPSLPIILGIGTNLHAVLPTDINGARVADMPMMDSIRTYENIDLVMDFTGSSTVYTWVYYAYTRFGVRVAAGVTGVIAAELYPLLQTGQLIGLLSGLKDAAEYEQHADEIEHELNLTPVRKENHRQFMQRYRAMEIESFLQQLLMSPPQQPAAEGEQPQPVEPRPPVDELTTQFVDFSRAHAAEARHELSQEQEDAWAAKFQALATMTKDINVTPRCSRATGRLRRLIKNWRKG